MGNLLGVILERWEEASQAEVGDESSVHGVALGRPWYTRGAEANDEGQDLMGKTLYLNSCHMSFSF